MYPDNSLKHRIDFSSKDCVERLKERFVELFDTAKLPEVAYCLSSLIKTTDYEPLYKFVIVKILSKDFFEKYAQSQTYEWFQLIQAYKESIEKKGNFANLDYLTSFCEFLISKAQISRNYFKLLTEFEEIYPLQIKQIKKLVNREALVEDLRDSIQSMINEAPQIDTIDSIDECETLETYREEVITLSSLYDSFSSFFEYEEDLNELLDILDDISSNLPDSDDYKERHESGEFEDWYDDDYHRSGSSGVSADEPKLSEDDLIRSVFDKE